MTTKLRPRAAIETKVIRNGKVVEVIRGNGHAPTLTGRGVAPAAGGAELVTRRRTRDWLAPRSSSTPTASTVPGPIKSVFIDQYASRSIRREGATFDGDETAFVAYGWREDGVAHLSYVFDVSDDRQRSSVRLDPEKCADAEDRVAHLDVELVADVHVHPQEIGPANPSTADLRWWRKQLDRSKAPYYVGVIVTRQSDHDSSWNYPVWSAFVISRDTAGELRCEIVPVEVEPDDH